MRIRIGFGFFLLIFFVKIIPVSASQVNTLELSTETTAVAVTDSNSESAESLDILQYEVDGNSYISLNLETGKLVIFNKHIMNDYSLDELPEWYEYRSYIKSVEINGSLLKIGDYAFYGCENIESVTTNNDLQEIGEGAFEECRKLQNIKCGPSLTVIDSFAFYDCCNMVSVEFDNKSTLKTIESHAFGLCGKLEIMKIPNSVELIEDNAFIKCANLKDIWNEDSLVQEIGIGAFAYCTSLEELSLKNLNTIGASAFYECSGLKSVNLPNVKEINEYAFFDCSAIQQVVIPEVESIGNYSFAENSQLINMQMGQSILEIGDYSFDNCVKMKDITLTQSSSLQSIGAYAFHNCSSLTEMIIPETTTYLGEYLFCGCSKLDVIDVYALQISFGENVCKDLLVTMYFYNGSTGIQEAINQNISYDYFTMVSTSDFIISYQQNWIYTGSQIKPDVVVKYQNNILKENEDYTVEYGDNIFGTGTITIQGKRSYCDSIKKIFTIEKADQNIGYTNELDKNVTDASFFINLSGIMENAECTYIINDTKVATCNKSGKVQLTGVVGKTNIVIKVSETSHYKEAIITIPLIVNKNIQNINTSASIYEKYVTDQPFNLKVKVKDSAKVTYKISNTKILSCSKSGKVTLNGKKGTCTIIITAKATNKYNKAVQKITVKVTKLPKVKVSAYKTSNGFKMSWGAVKGVSKVKYCFKIKGWSNKWYSTNSIKSYKNKSGYIRSNLWVKIRVYDKNGRLLAESDQTKVR